MAEPLLKRVRAEDLKKGDVLATNWGYRARITGVAPRSPTGINVFLKDDEMPYVYFSSRHSFTTILNDPSAP